LTSIHFSQHLGPLFPLWYLLSIPYSLLLIQSKGRIEFDKISYTCIEWERQWYHFHRRIVMLFKDKDIIS